MKAPQLVLLLLVLGSCTGRESSASLGQPVDPGAVVTLAAALEQAPPAEVTLRGEVQQVCTASGCWFTLRERTADSIQDLHVDLLPAADFRLDPSAIGKTVVVRGRLAGDPDRELQALGLVFE